MTGSFGTVVNREDWVQYAACGSIYPELFFPASGASIKDARRICIGCPVQRECLLYALENRIAFGVWGGCSEGERQRMKLRRDA